MHSESCARLTQNPVQASFTPADTNVAKRAIRPHTLTRKNALFAGSDGGARHCVEAAKAPSVAYANGKLPEGIATTLIQTAKLSGVAH